MQSFLGLEGSRHSAAQAAVVILPVPYDATTSFHAGARHAPDAVLRASEHIEEYDEELEQEICECGLYTAPAVEPQLDGPETMVAHVQSAVDGWLQANKRVVTLGGDHTVAVGAVWAHAARHGPLSVLQIDAHADLRDTWDGSRFSHACAARRMAEQKQVSQVVGVGVRALSRPEVAVAQGPGHRLFLAKDLANQEPETWIPDVVAALSERVYVTVDVDGLDPSVVPATGTPEPGGLSWWTALRLLRQVGRERTVVGADLCELCPAPGLHASDVTVARLLYKMVGYFWSPGEAAEKRR